MIPNFTIIDREISAYLICVIVGIFVSGIVTLKSVDKEKENDLLDILLWSAPGAFLGGHLLYGLTNLQYLIQLFSNEFNIVTLINLFAGSVFYGGMLGGLLSAWIYCKVTSQDYKKYSDNGALFIPLFHVFGRIGCFLSGCCYGIESSVGIIYQHSAIAMANGVRRFPIQLVEALGNLILFLVLFHLYRKGKFQGKLLTIYLLSYAAMRFIDEFFRGDEFRGFVLGLSTSQIISLLIVIVVLMAMIIDKKKNYKNGGNLDEK